MQQQGKYILFDNWKEFKTWLDKQNIKRKVKTIQQHHTWKPNYTNTLNHFQLCTNMETYHIGSAGMSDIAQNITTFKDGKVMVCRSLEKNPAGIYGQNSGAICIEHIANFDSEIMTDKHKECILGVTASLCTKFGLDVNKDTIVYHHWFDLNTGKRTNGIGSVKTCPGTNFFGGNKVANAEASFYPAVRSYINPVVKKEEPEMRELKNWEKQVFEECLKKGIITDKNWASKPDEKIDVVHVLAMLLNVFNKLDK